MAYNADGTEAGYATTNEYRYDELGQLVYDRDYTAHQLYEYTYDAGGNLLKEHLTIYSTSGAVVTTQDKDYAYADTNWKDKLTSYGGKAITYDAIGNPLSYRGMTMTWQNGRQLASLQKGTTAVSYTYDVNGTRTTKTVNGVKYTYQYIGGKLIHETRGEKSFHYYYDANGYLTAIKYRLTPDGEDFAYYATHNWRGDVIGLYNGDGELRAKYEYDTWGQRVKKTVWGTVFSDERHSRYRAAGGVAVAPVKKGITDQNHVGNLNPFRYRGYYYDTESQLYYLMTRYYDPVTHRFLNADGYYQSGGALLDTNMNAYCGNNPVSNFDPDGTCWIPQYTNAGTYIGSKWQVMGHVPGADYYCYKCGGCNPAVYPNAPKGSSTPSNSAFSSNGGPSSSSIVLDVTDAVNKAVRNEVAIFEAHHLDAFWFREQVDHDGPWNIKVEEKWLKKIGSPYPGSAGTQVMWDGQLVTPEILGNMTYGYLGKKVGFDLSVLLAGGDLADGGIWGVLTRSDSARDKESIMRGYYITNW